MAGLLGRGNIPHALLFTGIDGIGKRKTALTVAAALNCRTADRPETGGSGAGAPCGQCRPCRKIISGNHPDVIVITPEKSRIKISAIRELVHTLAAKPYEASWRVVVIDQAEAMNPEAGNALLKLLEEPPENTILILTAGNTHSLLPTIVSRCQQVTFNPIPEKALVDHLEKQGLPHDKAAILAKQANGSYAKADRLVGTGWIGRREWILRVVAPPEGHDEPSLRIGALLAFSERLSRDREAIPDALDILTSWFRDLAVAKAGSGRLVNTDLAERIISIAAHYRMSRLLDGIAALETAKKNIQANLNPRLVLDIMMMKL